MTMHCALLSNIRLASVLLPATPYSKTFPRAHHTSASRTSAYTRYSSIFTVEILFPVSPFLTETTRSLAHLTQNTYLKLNRRLTSFDDQRWKVEQLTRTEENEVISRVNYQEELGMMLECM